MRDYSIEHQVKHGEEVKKQVSTTSFMTSNGAQPNVFSYGAKTKDDFIKAPDFQIRQDGDKFVLYIGNNGKGFSAYLKNLIEYTEIPDDYKKILTKIASSKNDSISCVITDPIITRNQGIRFKMAGKSFLIDPFGMTALTTPRPTKIKSSLPIYNVAMPLNFPEMLSKAKISFDNSCTTLIKALETSSPEGFSIVSGNVEQNQYADLDLKSKTDDDIKQKVSTPYFAITTSDPKTGVVTNKRGFVISNDKLIEVDTNSVKLFTYKKDGSGANSNALVFKEKDSDNLYNITDFNNATANKIAPALGFGHETILPLTPKSLDGTISLAKEVPIKEEHASLPGKAPIAQPKISTFNSPIFANATYQLPMMLGIFAIFIAAITGMTFGLFVALAMFGVASAKFNYLQSIKKNLGKGDSGPKKEEPKGNEDKKEDQKKPVEEKKPVDNQKQEANKELTISEKIRSYADLIALLKESNAVLEDKILNIRTEKSLIEGKVTTLSNEIETLENHISSLTDEASQATKIALVDSKNTKNVELEKLKQDSMKLNKELTDTQNKLNKQKSTCNDLTTKVDELKVSAADDIVEAVKKKKPASSKTEDNNSVPAL